MYIAGPMNDKNTGELTNYSRSLKEKIKRLKLTQKVILQDVIKGDQEKVKFFNGAHISMNLSKSIEESFPKASIEPLGLGIPVIACKWNGFVETILIGE